MEDGGQRLEARGWRPKASDLKPIPENPSQRLARGGGLMDVLT